MRWITTSHPISAPPRRIHQTRRGENGRSKKMLFQISKAMYFNAVPKPTSLSAFTFFLLSSPRQIEIEKAIEGNRAYRGQDGQWFGHPGASRRRQEFP